MVRAFAANSGSDVSVIVANRAGVDVTIPVSSSNSSWVAVGATTLDQTTYQLVYNSTTQNAHLGASGLGHPSASDKSTMSLTLQGYGVAVVTFAPVAPIDHTPTFSETGLPSGSTWAVTLGGSTHSSTTSKVTFSEPNGAYSYTVPAIAGFLASPTKGTMTLNGADASQTIQFTPLIIRYPVSFNESGLPSGASWSLVLGATQWNSSESAIGIALRNGTYDFSISSETAYRPNPSTGELTVSGGPQNVSISFAPLPPGNYPVTFAEVGLTLGASWSVTLGSDPRTSTTNQVEFTLTNGTYDYSLGFVPGYTVSVESGSVTIHGAPDALLVTFVPILSAQYPVTFSEAGLPTGENWSVEVGSTTQPSTSSTDVFSELNGTYPYFVGEVAGYQTAESTGSVTVAGAAAAVTVEFVPGQHNNGSAPPGGSGGGTTTGGSSGLGGVLLNWVSLGFLGSSVGGSTLRAIQAAFAVTLVFALAALVVRWPRPTTSTSSENVARPVRIRTGNRPGFRPPPS
jgi:hypothetical protein